MTTYEVTVPVTVTITGRGHIEAITFDEFGGFFSEAEESCGAWRVDNEEWARDDRGWRAADRARNAIRAAVVRCYWIETAAGEGKP